MALCSYVVIGNPSTINMICRPKSVRFPCAGGHSGPPLRRGFVSLNGRIEAVNRFSISVSKPNTNKRDIAMRGGMWSGWAASRTGQLSDTESQLTFGGW